MLNRIQVTTVLVSDQDRALDFYVNKLGLKVKFDMPMEGFRWLEVMPEGAETSINLTKPFPGMRAPGGPTGMIFDTSNVNSAYETLKGRGVQFTQAPTPQPWGGI
jgi:catechol 2,3-dioxygenase-like lactoylglutathione lyase family enzyme